MRSKYKILKSAGFTLISKACDSEILSLLSLRKRSCQGFTLIELLVVTGILTFLLAMVVIAINPVSQLSNARDTQRHSDVNIILNAIDQYLVKNSALPAGITTSTQIIKSGGGGVDLCSMLVTEFVAALPVDPSTGSYTDCSNYDTGYTVVKSSTNNRVTVNAPSAENATITVSR